MLEVNAQAAQSLYQSLCDAADILPVTELLALEALVERRTLGALSSDSRLTHAISALLWLQEEFSEIEDVEVDQHHVDLLMAHIDHKVQQQLDAVIHHTDFQALEARWRGVQFLTERTDFHANIKYEILNVTKEELAENFSNSHQLSQSGLFHHVYTDEYDTPGGEPYAAIISDWQFDARPSDIELLDKIASVASISHCPFIATVGPSFFQQQSWQQVLTIENLAEFLDQVEFLPWQTFRQQPHARFVGLTLPKFLLRAPYEHNTFGSGFCYQEANMRNEQHLWGAASFAFAVNLSRSFKDHGWSVHIRGPESGGKVSGLPLCFFNNELLVETKIPTEGVIPETQELQFADNGFIPLSYYKNSNFACFFSANSAQRPGTYFDSKLTATSRVNARLPYVLLCSRIAHYLKVLQRESIGSNKAANVLEQELNAWLQTLVTKMHNPEPDIIASHPLQEAYVDVTPRQDDPGLLQVSIYLMPHFQVEGIDVQLNLVAQMPGQVIQH